MGEGEGVLPAGLKVTSTSRPEWDDILRYLCFDGYVSLLMNGTLIFRSFRSSVGGWRSRAEELSSALFVLAQIRKFQTLPRMFGVSECILVDAGREDHVLSPPRF